MNTPSRVIITAGKAAVLSSGLFSTTLIACFENESMASLPIIFILCMVITFIISFVMVLFTIVPFYELTPNLSVDQKFKKYFPLYSISFFLGCSCIIYCQNYELIINIIFGIAYVTAMQSWVWFFKLKKNENN